MRWTGFFAFQEEAGGPEGRRAEGPDPTEPCEGCERGLASGKGEAPE